MCTVLEERATSVASFIYDRAPSNLHLSLSLLFPFSLLGVVILMFAFRDVCRGFTPKYNKWHRRSRLPSVLETMVVEDKVEYWILVLVVVAPKEEIEPVVPASETISLEAKIYCQEDIGTPRVEPAISVSGEAVGPVIEDPLLRESVPLETEADAFTVSPKMTNSTIIIDEPGCQLPIYPWSQLSLHFSLRLHKIIIDPVMHFSVS